MKHSSGPSGLFRSQVNEKMMHSSGPSGLRAFFVHGSGPSGLFRSQFCPFSFTVLPFVVHSFALFRSQVNEKMKHSSRHFSAFWPFSFTGERKNDAQFWPFSASGLFRSQFWPFSFTVLPGICPSSLTILPFFVHNFTGERKNDSRFWPLTSGPTSGLLRSQVNEKMNCY